MNATAAADDRAQQRAVAVQHAVDHARRGIAACRAARCDEPLVERCAELLRVQRHLENALLGLEAVARS
jgi:hypothetical protein